MARRLSLLALALVLCGAGAWLFLASPSEDADPPRRGATAERTATAVDGGPGDLQDAADPARETLVTSAGPPPSGPGDPSPGGRTPLSARVTLRFLRADTAEPIGDFLFGLMRSDLPREDLAIPDGPRAEPWTPEGFGIVDGEGRCTFRVAQDAQYTGAMRARPGRPSPFDELTPTAVFLGPLDAGASEEILVRLHPKRRTTRHFRFVHAVTGEPVGDVRIHPIADRWIKPSMRDARRGLWSPLTELVARASPSGDLALNAWDLDGPAEVFADGHGPAWIRFQEGSSEAEPRVVELTPPGRIRGRIGQLPPGPEAGEIQLRAAHTDLGFRLVRGGDNDLSAWHVRLPLGPDGTFVAEDVPASGRVTLEVLRGAELAHRTQVRVPPGGVLDFEWSWVPKVALAGVLLDAEGEAVPDGQVWLHPTRASLEYTTFRSVRRPQAYANTGPDGRFRFEGVAPGRYGVGPAKGAGPGYARVVDVPHQGVLTVEPPPDARVRGQVLLDGAGVAGVSVQTTEGYFTRTDDDGQFDLPCLGVSAVSVFVGRAWSRGEDRYVGRRTVRATPGDSAVVLELVPEVRRGAVAVDASSGEPVRAAFSVVLIHGSGGVSLRRWVGAPEALHSLRVADAPTIIWAATDDGRVGRSERLAPAGLRGRTETRISVAPGGRLKVTTGARRRVDVSDASGTVHAVWAGPAGEELALPAGRYRLTSGGDTREVEVEVGRLAEAPFP